jgi:hypothetical protein
MGHALGIGTLWDSKEGYNCAKGCASGTPASYSVRPRRRRRRPPRAAGPLAAAAAAAARGRARPPDPQRLHSHTHPSPLAPRAVHGRRA